MSSRTKKIVVILGLGLLILLVVLALGGNEKKPSGPGEGSSGMVYIEDPGNKLHDLLFDQQYYAVEAAVSDYILAKISPDVGSAKIVGDPTVPGNGLVEFKVQTDKPSRNFTVRLDRARYFDKIILTVNDTNYKQTVQVYQDPAPAEQTYE